MKNVEARWMRQMGTLMVNHGIHKGGRSCADCHAPGGILDWKALGYTESRAAELGNLPELSYFEKLQASSATKPASPAARPARGGAGSAK
ncbi:MAG: hypothetical protein U5J83_15250 [Bryobacterales bacterium]|nr:hypothetical protein [Bryobacterales bacterium]